jgi:hypothetical protein
MATKTDDISAALGQLDKILEEPAEQERAWAGLVDGALARLEEALRRQATELRPPNGRVPDVHRPLLPSPGEDRKAAGLQHELEEFLQTIDTLRAQTHDAGSAVEPLRERARALVQAVRRHEHAEVDLILDSVTTDIGAGD